MLRPFSHWITSIFNKNTHSNLVVRPESGPDNPLWTYFQSNQGRLIHKWHHYFDIYHNHFNRFRGKKITVLEIGVYHGGSLRMWKHYFGSKAKIFGIDVDERCKMLTDDQCTVFIGDSSDRKFLKQVFEKIGPIDIVIDDGGHTMNQQIAAFEVLYPAVKDTGVYLIEDLHTSYWTEYGGGYRSAGSFIEYAKQFIDSLNSWHSRDQELQTTPFTKATTGIHFYDSVLVLEKHPNHARPSVSKTGKESF